MSKPKLGIYYDLPEGGARRLMDSLVASLASSYDLVSIPAPVVPRGRLRRDLFNLIGTYFHARSLTKDIRESGIKAILVSHDHLFAAPAILTTSPVPTILYCHEPTRALFEPELGIDPSWPLLNRIYESIFRAVKKFLEKLNASHSTKILCNSEYTKRYIKHAYGQAATVVYPGVDESIFNPQACLRRQGQTLRALTKDNSILIVGNDEPQKRLSLAMRAVGLLKASTRPSVTLVCPRKRPSSKLLNIAKRHGIKLTVHVGITDQKLVDLYRQASLTLITALREPFGLSAVESLACGTPVVATAEGGVVEIVQDGVSGYLVEDVPSAIAAGIKKVLGDKERFAHVTTHFTIERCQRALSHELNQFFS
jgi:glycosyltransferase involved in cell wall biosynthesis